MSPRNRKPLRKISYTGDREQIDLLVDVARAYYEQNHDQASIAKSLGISRSQVSRYLSKAHELNLIQVRVVAPDERVSTLEDNLKQCFSSLKDAIVAPAFNYQPDPLRMTIGRACALYLESKMAPGLRVCIGSGRTLYETITWIHPRQTPNITIIQAMGSIGHELMNIDFNELARSAGSAFGARVIYLNAPAIMSAGSARELTAASASIREALQMACSADLFVVGIGSIQADLIFTQVGLISDLALDKLKDAGAVGDICARFFDQNGHIIPSSFDERIIGIRLEDLRGQGFTIGVGGGQEKVAPLLGALRGKFFNALVTDELTASRILELNKQGS